MKPLKAHHHFVLLFTSSGFKTHSGLAPLTVAERERQRDREVERERKSGGWRAQIVDRQQLK